MLTRVRCRRVQDIHLHAGDLKGPVESLEPRAMSHASPQQEGKGSMMRGWRFCAEKAQGPEPEAKVSVPQAEGSLP